MYKDLYTTTITSTNICPQPQPQLQSFVYNHSHTDNMCLQPQSHVHTCFCNHSHRYKNVSATTTTCTGDFKVENLFCCFAGTCRARIDFPSSISRVQTTIQYCHHHCLFLLFLLILPFSVLLIITIIIFITPTTPNLTSTAYVKNTQSKIKCLKGTMNS